MTKEILSDKMKRVTTHDLTKKMYYEEDVKEFIKKKKNEGYDFGYKDGYEQGKSEAIKLINELEKEYVGCMNFESVGTLENVKLRIKQSPQTQARINPI